MEILDPVEPTLLDFVLSILRGAYVWLNSVENPIIFSDLSLWEVGCCFFVVGTIINLITGDDDDLDDIDDFNL